MEDVRTTVRDALRQRGYDQYIGAAEPVITVLENRERDIAGVLIEYATQAGMQRTQIEQALTSAGMVLPGGTPPTAVPQAGTSTAGPPVPGSARSAVAQNEASSDPVLDALARIEQRLDGLTTFARANGYTG